MGKFWQLFKQSWHDEMVKYGMIQPTNTGTGNGYDTEPYDPEVAEWEARYRKFRKLYGRYPYAFKELQDWWDSF